MARESEGPRNARWARRTGAFTARAAAFAGHDDEA
jgi:hypothetical protein